jgi:hypothetical protein
MRSLSDSAPAMKTAGLEPAPDAPARAALPSAARSERANSEGTEPVVQEQREPELRAKPALDLPGADNSQHPGFRVKRLVLTRGIENKEPIDTSAFKPDGSPVYAFVELENAAASDETIEIVFEHESGQKVGFVKLDVPKEHERWRTWGRTRQIKKSGAWAAVVLSASGEELMRQAFTVQTS